MVPKLKVVIAESGFFILKTPRIASFNQQSEWEWRLASNKLIYEFEDIYFDEANVVSSEEPDLKKVKKFFNNSQSYYYLETVVDKIKEDYDFKRNNQEIRELYIDKPFHMIY